MIALMIYGSFFAVPFPFDLDSDASTTLKLNIRQRQSELMQELEIFFPITDVRGWLSLFEKLISAQSQGRMAIRGLILPQNSQYFVSGAAEEDVATALGFVVHLVIMVSRYYRIPIRYQVKQMGSRSQIYDPITMIQYVESPL